MKRNIHGIGVDAGMIIIADKDYFNPTADTNNHLVQSIEVKPGTYQVSWSIPSTFHGPQGGIQNLYIPSGTLIIGDPCYIIPDEDWHEWLNITNYGKNLGTHTAFILDSMGGDGYYTVKLNLIRQCDRKGNSI